MDINLEIFLKQYLSPDDKIILACSTWPDSMFLLHKLLETSYRNDLIVCYFNHKTRPETDTEEQFLIDLWRKEWFQVEVAECDFEKIQKLYPSKSFEELAREKRYQFFEAVVNIYKSKYILTAHHLDDRIETYMFNMLRGSKLTGLINMTECSWNILRPLLWVEKSAIYEYLQDNNLTFFEDSTNTDDSYTRNYIRNQVLPLFEKVHPEHKKNLQNLFGYFEQLKEHIDKEVQKFLSDTRDFSIQWFQSLSPLIQKEVIRYIYYISNNRSTIGLSESNIQEVIKFINGKNNKTTKEIRGLKMKKENTKIVY
jgi:tRNA(Ile)-lysidine synthase